MGNYSGAVCRFYRREGAKLYLKGERCYTPRCAFGRRPFAPGMHGQARKRKPSDYGLQLRAKQALCRAWRTASGVAASLVFAGLLVGCGAQGPGVDLHITGAMTADVVGDQASCSPAPAAGPAGMIASFAVVPNGLHYNLRFLTNRVGAGEYNVSTAGTFVAFNGEGSGWSTLNDHSGKLVVNADGRSGTIDVTLSPEPGSPQSSIRITGSWRCPA